MSYSKRLKGLQDSWDKDQPVEGFSPIPDDKYQFEIAGAKLVESKARNNEGNLCVLWELKVATGKYKGKIIRKWIDLEYDGDSEQNVPSGRSMLKGVLKNIGLDIPKKLTEKALQGVLNEALDTIVEGNVVTSKSGFANVYINRCVDAGEEEIEDDEDDEVDEEEEEEIDEEEEEEEEVKSKKKSKSKSKKKSKKVDEEIEDDEEYEDEEEEEDEDEDEWE